MKNRILLAVLLGCLCLSVQAKPTKSPKSTKPTAIVQNGMYYVESNRESVAGVSTMLSDVVNFSLQASKPTAKTCEEDCAWWLVLYFGKAQREVVVKENSDLLTLNLFDGTNLKLRPSSDINGALNSVGSANSIYYIHVIFYPVNLTQIEQIINTGVESMQFSYGYDKQSISAEAFNQSFKEDKIGATLKEMYSAVKSTIDEL